MADMAEVYAELYRRKAVPDEHKPVVDELIRRGVINVDVPPPVYRNAERDMEAIDRDGNGAFSSLPAAMTNAATLGTLPNIMAGMETALVSVPRAIANQQPLDIGTMYDENLRFHRAKRDRAAQNTGGTSGVGAIARDVAGGAMLAPANALMRGVQAAPSLANMMKTGALWGGAGAFLSTDGSDKKNATWADHIVKRAENVPVSAAVGALAVPALAYGVPAVARAADRVISEPVRAIGRAIRGPAQSRAEEFATAGVAPFAPALSDTVGAPANALMGGFFGGSLRRGARQSIDDIERGVNEAIATTGGTRPVNEIGTEAQDFIRRQIRERNDAIDVPNLSRFEMQDISGIGPGPNAPRNAPPVAPARPEPWNPQRRAVTDDEIDRAMVQPPRQQTETPKQITPDDIPPPPEMGRRLADAEANERGAVAWLNQNQAQIDAMRRQANELRQRIPPMYGPVPIGAQMTADDIAARQAHTAAEPLRRQLQALEQQIAPLERQYTAATEAIGEAEAARRVVQSYRAASLRAAQDAENARVSRDADANYQMRLAESRREAEERLNRVADAEHIQNMRDPMRRQAFENQARNRARADTERRQHQADTQYASELERRQARAIPERVGGNSREPYMTEFDVGYEAARRNTPPVMMNPLGRPGDSGMTQTAGLLDSIALQARRQNMLPGYRRGEVFGADNRVRPEILDMIDGLAGREIGERFRALSDTRTRGAVQTSIQGLDEIRSMVGKALADARSPRFPEQTQRGDAAFLARLYDALGRDVEAVVAAAPGGSVAARQRQVLRESYRAFIDEIRGPLGRIVGDKTTPEQFVAKIREAARGQDRGNLDLLRAYFRVADEKGDRYRATGLLLNEMADGGLANFITRWREMPDEVRRLMALGDAEIVVRRLDQLARVGGYMERFVANAAPVQTTAQIARRTASSQNVMTALIAMWNAPTAIAMAGGQVGASRVLASPAFQRWLLKLPQTQTPRDTTRHVERLMQIAASQMGLHPSMARKMALMVIGGQND